MLILTRRPGESFQIDLSENVDPNLTVAELFAEGPIEIVIIGVKGNQVRVGTQASDRLTILRDELYETWVMKRNILPVANPEDILFPTE